MIIETGNIWSAYNDAHIIAVPSCSTVRDGKLVMARGLAKQVSEAHAGIDEMFGALIRKLYGSNGYFYWLYKPQNTFTGVWDRVSEEFTKFALIQTKTRHMNDIENDILLQGLWSMQAVAEYNPEKEIHTILFKNIDMSFLPDNVYAWKRK